MDLKKLMEMKKGGPAMDPRQKEAKMAMLQALKAEMSGMMKEDLQHPGMKKVSVASDDASGLSEGLDKAKEMIDSVDHNSDGSDVEQEDMFDSSPEMEESSEEGDFMQHEGLSPEEELLLSKLLAKKGK